MLDRLAAQRPKIEDRAPLDDVVIRETYQIVVECRDEPEQRGLYERLAADGFKCRVLSL
jgi:hypothetical protein